MATPTGPVGFSPASAHPRQAEHQLNLLGERPGLVDGERILDRASDMTAWPGAR
ncbi:hypothetical protein [Micromonospora zhanjiangensis]|uniref:Uncharacterized protein n=1 Tax=Micromonospora zhanjiangensis TaxID=1522057 RepID=A0ABV8KFC8_9ACTN